jgi:hypothetical protein
MPADLKMTLGGIVAVTGLDRRELSNLRMSLGIKSLRSFRHPGPATYLLSDFPFEIQLQVRLAQRRALVARGHAA